MICGAVLAGALAAEYSINWHTTDGGGGTCSGGTYQIRGTIGQPEALPSPMAGGEFSLTGGFWTVAAVQVEGTPTLRIQRAGSDQVTVSWVPDTLGWVLQESESLAPGSWVNCPSGSTNPITLPTTAIRKFYRLAKP